LSQRRFVFEAGLPNSWPHDVLFQNTHEARIAA
jgi:hypothetical protein